MAANGLPVRAGAELAGSRAGEVVAPDCRERPSAGAAECKTGQKVLLATLLPKLGFLDGFDAGISLDLALSLFDRLPKFIPDNPQLGDLRDDPFGGIVETGNAFAGLGVLDITQPVPDQATNVELIVEKACCLTSAPTGQFRPI